MELLFSRSVVKALVATETFGQSIRFSSLTFIFIIMPKKPKLTTRAQLT